MKSFRYSRMLFALLAIILLITGCALNVCAFDFDGTESSRSEQNENQFHLIDRENRTERIGDYDINENNEVAVATSEYINIYDETGRFLYGYSVSVAGAYAIDFYTDTLEIYLVRPRELIRLDRRGNIISVSSMAADDSVVSEMTADMRKASKEYADCRYQMNASLTELIKIDPNGEELLIYETSPYKRVANYMFVAALLLIALTVFSTFLKRKRAISSRSNTEQDRDI